MPEEQFLLKMAWPSSGFFLLHFSSQTRQVTDSNISISLL